MHPLLDCVTRHYRDSVSLFKEKIREEGNYEDSDTDHFENIQSTNWQTMRFKPPPPGDSIGLSAL